MSRVPDLEFHDIVELANEFGQELAQAASDEQRYEMVMRQVAGSDVVYAVWNDPDAEDGVGFLLIKGQQRLRELIADGKNPVARFAGIPCVEAGQALALLNHAGEQDSRH
jgi:hypothetical protein